MSNAKLNLCAYDHFTASVLHSVRYVQFSAFMQRNSCDLPTLLKLIGLWSILFIANPKSIIVVVINNKQYKVRIFVHENDNCRGWAAMTPLTGIIAKNSAKSSTCWSSAGEWKCHKEKCWLVKDNVQLLINIVVVMLVVNVKNRYVKLWTTGLIMCYLRVSMHYDIYDIDFHLHKVIGAKAKKLHEAVEKNSSMQRI